MTTVEVSEVAHTVTQTATSHTIDVTSLVLPGATIRSPTITDIVEVTQAAYDDLSPPDPNTLYLIIS